MFKIKSLSTINLRNMIAFQMSNQDYAKYKLYKPKKRIKSTLIQEKEKLK